MKLLSTTTIRYVIDGNYTGYYSLKNMNLYFKIGIKFRRDVKVPISPFLVTNSLFSTMYLT